MWTAPLQFLLRYWLPVLTVTLAGLLWIQTTRFDNEREAHRVTKADHKIRSDMAIAAESQQKKEYDDALTSATARTKTLVEQAEKNAWSNYIKRYGMPKPVVGNVGDVGAVRLCNVSVTSPTDTPTNEGASQLDGATREFVASCANDAARLSAWIALCQDAKCEVIP